MGLCLGNWGWPQNLSQRRLKQDQNHLYHRQICAKICAKSTLKERAMKRIAPQKQQREKSGRRFENSGSDSEDTDDLPIILVKRTKQPSAEVSTAQADPTAMQQRDADSGSDQETIPARSGDLDRNPRDPATSNPGDQPTQAPSKKRTIKEGQTGI